MKPLSPTPQWIWSKDDAYASHQLVLFRRHFSVGSDIQKAVLKMAANVWYEAYLNGQRIGRGHTLSDVSYKYVDRYTVSGKLRRGRNTLAIMVYCTGHRRSSWLMQERGPGGLWLQLQWEQNAKRHRVVSDEAWRAIAAPGWRPSPGVACMHRGNFKEHIDLRQWREDWNRPGFNDRRWTLARSFTAENKGFWGRLVDREIPHLKEDDVKPVNAYSISHGAMYGSAPAHGWEIDEPQVVVSPEAAASAWNCLAHGANKVPPKPMTHAKIMPGRDGFKPSMIVDFGRLVYGRPEIDISAKAGGQLQLAYGESLNLTFLDQFDFGAGKQTLGPVQDRFFRYLLLNWQITRPIELSSVHVRRRYYPVKYVGQFTCDNELLNNIWQVGVETAHLNMYEHFVDCPFREHGLYWDDLSVQAESAYSAFSDTRLLRKCLRQGAWVQHTDGRLHSSVPDAGAGIFLVDFMPHYIRALWLHYWLSGNKDLLRELWPTVQRVVQWYEHHAGADGLLDITQHLKHNKQGHADWWCYLDWSYVEKRGQITGLNMLYYHGLCTARRMAQALEQSEQAARLGKLARRLRNVMTRRMWSAHHGGYVDCVVKDKPSQHVGEVTNALALWTGLAHSTQTRAITQHLKGHATHLATGGPMLTRICQALFQQHKDALAFDRIDRYWGEMVRRGATSYWEVFDSHLPDDLWPHKLWSTCHGWSSGVVTLLHQYVLGVGATSPGGRDLLIQPHAGSLREAQGTVPTAAGPVHVRWYRRGRGMKVEVNAPKSVRWKVMTP